MQFMWSRAITLRNVDFMFAFCFEKSSIFTDRQSRNRIIVSLAKHLILYLDCIFTIMEYSYNAYSVQTPVKRLNKRVDVEKTGVGVMKS